MRRSEMKLTCDRYVHCNGNSRCGTSLKGELEVTFHHGKTKHDIFSESSEQIKPLTKEEKEQKVMEMREKIRVAMARKQEKEEQEANEKVSSISFNFLYSLGNHFKKRRHFYF